MAYSMNFWRKVVICKQEGTHFYLHMPVEERLESGNNSGLIPFGFNSPPFGA